MDIGGKFAYHPKIEGKMLNIILKHTLCVNASGILWIHSFSHVKPLSTPSPMSTSVRENFLLGQAYLKKKIFQTQDIDVPNPAHRG